MAIEQTTNTNVQLSDAVRLCLSCGICCSGVLFAYAPLKQDEIGLATKAGLEKYTFSKDDEGEAFKQPCACWEGKCTIYPNRPDVCGSYRCQLLQRLDDGKVSLEQALEIVSRTKNLVHSITLRLDTGNVSEPLWERIGQFYKNQTAKGSLLENDDKANLELMLSVGTLLALLKEFEPDHFVQEMPGGPEVTSDTQKS